MPYIDLKTTVTLTDSVKDDLSRCFGKSIGLMHKPESYLMVSLSGGNDMYFGGKKLDKGAMVKVEALGDVNGSDCNKMTGDICKILEEKLGIPGSCVYVTYQGIHDWGFNGRNF